MDDMRSMMSDLDDLVSSTKKKRATVLGKTSASGKKRDASPKRSPRITTGTKDDYSCPTLDVKTTGSESRVVSDGYLLKQSKSLSPNALPSTTTNKDIPMKKSMLSKLTIKTGSMHNLDRGRY